MNRAASHPLKRLLRQGEVGQTIVIMAFGFVVLLGFVGIVTDVSLMFVRYSTLRRAVDSAAVAAAGQMRRGVPTTDELNRAAAGGGTPQQIEARASGYAFARNIATVNLAARQFIEFYGLNPTAVVVDTCATLPGDAELCTADQRKLVRVTAQVDSPTVFLRLLGWGTVTLESSAISETAVLDVVLIFDVSESMLNETSYEDWETVGLGARFVPPRMEEVAAAQGLVNSTPLWLEVLNKSQQEIYTDPRFANATRAFIPPNTPISMSDSRVPAPQCRVRFFPNGGRIPDGTGRFAPQDNVLQEIRTFLGSYNYTSWDGFVPNYNFYGCCNDPNQDWNFSDLVCQPFKQARDATLNFVKQVDFVRGDRVALVTFDRGATLMKPERPPNTPVSHMIDNEDDVVNLIRKTLGVRAETNFYADTNNDGLWDAYNIGMAPYGEPGTQAVGFGVGSYFDGRPLGQIAEYPVKDSCPFINASLAYPRSLYSAPDVVTNPYRFPNALAAIQNPIMTPNLNDPAWDALIPSTWKPFKALYTYERRASCRGTNMGAGLREANNALLNPSTVRTNGAVWVMVLLSDGASGASDPVRRGSNPEQPLTRANPYTGLGTNLGAPPAAGQYGVYGLCPYGTPSNPRELIADRAPGFPYCGDEKPETRHFCFDPEKKLNDGSIYIDIENPRFPNCALEYDVDDYARDWADYVGLLEPFPWLTVGGGSSSVRSDRQLPTIFSIGFGLSFRNGTTLCKGSGVQDYEDCLGEELLRYVADVGDNFQIDTDYQQDLRNDTFANWTLDVGDDWGVRGPCEGPILNGHATVDAARAAGAPYSDIINPRPAGESCGNYFNATTGLELQRVFDEIASRMFTRLAR